MADLIRKIFRGEIRAVDTRENTVEAVISDETIDRYQEVILVSAWEKNLKKYKEHPVLLSSHRYHDLRSQIGEAQKVRVEDGKLVAKFKYYVGEGNPEADWGFKLAEKKRAAFSVGFIPHVSTDGSEDEKNYSDAEEKAGKRKKPTRIYKEVELIEVSQVLVPANPSALQKSIYGVDLDMEDPVVKTLVAELKKDAEGDHTGDPVPEVEDPEKTPEVVPDVETDPEIGITMDSGILEARIDPGTEELKEKVTQLISMVEQAVDLIQGTKTVLMNEVAVIKLMLIEKAEIEDLQIEDPEKKSIEEGAPEDYIEKLLSGVSELSFGLPQKKG